MYNVNCRLICRVTHYFFGQAVHSNSHASPSTPTDSGDDSDLSTQWSISEPPGIGAAYPSPRNGPRQGGGATSRASPGVARTAGGEQGANSRASPGVAKSGGSHNRGARARQQPVSRHRYSSPLQSRFGSLSGNDTGLFRTPEDSAPPGGLHPEMSSLDLYVLLKSIFSMNTLQGVHGHITADLNAEVSKRW